jgi:hypothetical protein
MILIPHIVVSFLVLAHGVLGWGADTHPTIAYIAEKYLLKETVQFPLPTPKQIPNCPGADRFIR